jgi:hypothetical protein
MITEIAKRCRRNNSIRRYDVLLAAKHLYIDLCSAGKHSSHVPMSEMSTTLKYERRNMTLLKDSMKVTADREKGERERGNGHRFGRIVVSINEALRGWGVVVNRF